MDQERQDKLLQVYGGGMSNYILRHGVINWGFSTGILFRTLVAITTHGWSLRGIGEVLFATETLFAMIGFGVVGIAFGFFMWKWIEREVKKIPPKPVKEKKGKNNKKK